MHEKQIEVRWRDFDAARHVNNARSRPLSPDELAALDSAREPHSAGQT